MSSDRRQVGPCDGFTLIEVLAATVVLLIGTVAATGLFTLSTAVAKNGTATAMAREKCRAAAEALLAEPFLSVHEGPDLVSTVFPHADPQKNTQTARFSAGGEAEIPPGSFVIDAVAGPCVVRTVARFVRFSRAEPSPLAVDEVIGWQGQSRNPPADALLVEVCVTCGRAHCAVELVSGADRDVRRLIGGWL